MSVKAVALSGVAALTVAGSIALASGVDRGPAECSTDPMPARSQTADGIHGVAEAESGGHGHGHAGRPVVGPSCNLVEGVAPHASTYRPDVRGASRADRAKARGLLRGVNAFCRTHSAPELTAEWVPGTGHQTAPTHFFNPDRRASWGLDPANPRAVLVYGDEIGGVMFTGAPLPSLGSIPRAHTHDSSRPREMLHVYCATDLAEAFTPRRQLGVWADSIALRQEIRPLVARLADPALTAVLRGARGYVGGELPRTKVRTSEAPELGDPVLRAKREEIRQSLPHLDEPQLRAVLSLVEGDAARPRS